VVRAFTLKAAGHAFDPRPRHTKDVIKMVPDAPLLSTQHIKMSGFSLLSNLIKEKKKEMDSIQKE